MSRAFVKEDAASWGDPSRRYSLEALLERARRENDERLEQLAVRYLK